MVETKKRFNILIHALIKTCSKSYIRYIDISYGHVKFIKITDKLYSANILTIEKIVSKYMLMILTARYKIFQ